MTSAALSVAYWKQERLVLKKGSLTAGSDVAFWTSLKGSAASPIAVYKADENGDVLIDVTDYMRTYGNAILYANAGGTMYAVSVTISGLINPDGVVIPPHWQYAKIVPPSMMIARDASNKSVRAEFYDYLQDTYAVSDASWSVDKRSILVAQNFDLLRLGTPTQTKHYILQPQKCGIEYAVVRWMSFTGTERVHVFEVTKHTQATDGAYSLQPIDNEYIEIKGRVDGMTLRLANLDAYDLWYYADILQSSEVEVSLSPFSAPVRVSVKTKNITLPDGEAKTKGVLEIQIEYKRYDAVAM
ncbi:MAG: hypothetical protein UHX00_05205 [Caryophanon sp.]|nr:hypothetical protein [Caryophanon sp.]